MTTIQAATADDACAQDLVSPGHVFPLWAQPKGVLARRGHTEATVDLMKMAGLRPYGVLCEVTNPDGTMARLPQIVEYGLRHSMPVLSVEDIVQYRQNLSWSGNEDLCPTEAEEPSCIA